MLTMRERVAELRLLTQEHGEQTLWAEVAHLVDRLESVELQVAMLGTLMQGKQDKTKANVGP